MMNEEILSEFKRRFNIVKSKGFVKSHRTNDTGIGKTFEDEMGIVENNLPDVDFMGYIEIKTKREESQSMLTLFTQSPDSPKGANGILRDKYGTPDVKYPELKVFHTTLSGNDFNTFNERKYGLKLVCDDSEQKIRIVIRDNQTNSILDEDIYYKYDTVKERVEHKCVLIAYVNADTKQENGTEYFHFTSVKLLSIKSFDDFIDGIRSGIVKYDFRIGAYKSGKQMGKPHDHGSGFRINKSDIPKLFNVEELN